MSEASEKTRAWCRAADQRLRAQRLEAALRTLCDALVDTEPHGSPEQLSALARAYVDAMCLLTPPSEPNQGDG